MKNKKLKVLLMTGVLTLGLCVGCGNNNEELTALQEKYDNSQKMVEQYKKDNEKLKEQNKALEQDKRTAESKLKELQSKEEPTDTTADNTTEETTDNAATESSNNDVWYTCEKCGVTNGKVKLHGAFYMCPNCISKQDNSSNTTTKHNTNNYNKHNSYKKHRKNTKRKSSFDNARDNVTTNQPSKGYVYWTPGGKSYHSSRNCPTLRRSKTVCGGYNCPKTDPCNICYK